MIVALRAPSLAKFGEVDTVPVSKFGEVDIVLNIIPFASKV